MKLSWLGALSITLVLLPVPAFLRPPTLSPLLPMSSPRCSTRPSAAQHPLPTQQGSSRRARTPSSNPCRRRRPRRPMVGQ